MKRFLTHLLWVLLPLALLAWPADRWLSQRLKASDALANGEYSVWNDIYTGKLNNKLAVYGSSRAWRHFDPELLGDSLGLDAYNLGMDGYGFYMQYMRHLEYFKHNTHPQYIILSLDLFTFEMPKGLYNSGQFIPYMCRSKEMKHFMQPLSGFSIYDYYVPMLRYFGKKTECTQIIREALKGSTQAPLRHKGFAGNPEQWNEDFKNAAKLREKYSVIIDPSCVQLMDRFLSDCARANIQVVMVYSPEFVAIKSFLSGKEQIMARYRSLADKHGLLFLDFSADPICTDQSNFYNASHMNAKGAQLFTQKLSHFLKTNGFRPKNLAVRP